jgi:hypothetical protein
MAEISLPVVARETHGWWVLEDADGMEICDFGTPYQPGDDGREVRDRACFVEQAVNDRANALARAEAAEAQVARVRALAERLQGGWHGACHFGPDWTEGGIVREVGRELLATIDGEGDAS